MIKYYVRPRKNPVTGVEKYYAAIAGSDIVSLPKLAKRISNACTVNVVDIKAVLAALEQVVIETLSAGDGVRLGELGLLRPTLTSEGAAAEKDVTADLIKKVNVRFLPTTAIKRELNHGNVQFAKHTNY